MYSVKWGTRMMALPNLRPYSGVDFKRRLYRKMTDADAEALAANNAARVQLNIDRQALLRAAWDRGEVA